MQYSDQFDSFGTRQVVPLPEESYLKKFYEDNYFQNNHSSYQKDYSQLEINYFNFYSSLFYYLASKFLGECFSNVLDIGCGEGFTSSWFYKKGIDVSAVDFSDFGIKSMHPDLLDKINFYKCDLVNDDYFLGEKFDLIILKGVLEHVKNSDQLLAKIKLKMHKDSVLLIMVPNDTDNPFLNQYLVNENLDFKDLNIFIPPEHLRYFSFSSLKKYMLSNGFIQLSQLGDFPIEMFLMDDRTNYYKSDFGKTAHSIRCSFMSTLHQLDKEKVITLLNGFADLGIGRSIIGFYKLLDDNL